MNKIHEFSAKRKFFSLFVAPNNTTRFLKTCIFFFLPLIFQKYKSISHVFYCGQQLPQLTTIFRFRKYILLRKETIFLVGKRSFRKIRKRDFFHVDGLNVCVLGNEYWLVSKSFHRRRGH